MRNIRDYSAALKVASGAVKNISLKSDLLELAQHIDDGSVGWTRKYRARQTKWRKADLANH